MIGMRTWKKRTVPLTTSDGSATLPRRSSQASIERRRPQGDSASAIPTIGAILLTLKAARRSERAT